MLNRRKKLTDLEQYEGWEIWVNDDRIFGWTDPFNYHKWSTDVLAFQFLLWIILGIIDINFGQKQHFIVEMPQ